ncbi:class I SAM-dependent methyltransferase [Baekduia sp.]|jgi:ubiquinone/menaquinone biosynthesis C-methylase UbiE|uniref:class I SAM-dependent methyltransferase n=1 Tax=Baekduia sp. TaxID=2600305 RepID=UPI002DFD641B|nr:class I SAM-dependent methyltransferase [Baekduia sp.]
MSDAAQDDRAFKARTRAMWATGDFPRVARETIKDVGPTLVAAAGVRAGQRVLDVAAGSGATSIPAALAGADVVASDLTPELLEAGEEAARDAGVELEWVEADAEDLPFSDASFDIVLSSFGAMFAPRHLIVADELLRVVRPGGTIAMANWTPEGWVGQFFLTMLPFMPPPPPGALPPPAWGVEDHVRSLFGEGVSELTFTRQIQAVDHFATPEALIDYYRENFGPTIMAYKSLAGDPEQTAALDAALMDFAVRMNLAGPGEPARYEFEYMIVVARRAA